MFFGQLASASARFLSCTLTSESTASSQLGVDSPAFCSPCARSAVFASRLLHFIDSRPVLAIAARYATNAQCDLACAIFQLGTRCECALQYCSSRGHGITVALPHSTLLRKAHNANPHRTRVAATPRVTRPRCTTLSRNYSNTGLTHRPLADNSKHEASPRPHRRHRRRLRRALGPGH